KHSGETIVIPLGNRNELVVVAARAADGEAEEGRASGSHDVVQVIGALLERTFGGLNADGIVNAGDEKPGCRLYDRIALTDHVARELFGHETRVRRIEVQSADDVIAVGPGVGTEVVLLVAIALAEADHVQPAARPAFAVGRRGEEMI